MVEERGYFIIPRIVNNFQISFTQLVLPAPVGLYLLVLSTRIAESDSLTMHDVPTILQWTVIRMFDDVSFQGQLKSFHNHTFTRLPRAEFASSTVARPGTSTRQLRIYNTELGIRPRASK